MSHYDLIVLGTGGVGSAARLVFQQYLAFTCTQMHTGFVDHDTA
jgi:hypothetical protein